MESLSQPIGNYKNLIYAKIGIIDKKAGQMYNFTCFFKIFFKIQLTCAYPVSYRREAYHRRGRREAFHSHAYPLFCRLVSPHYLQCC